MPPPPISLGPDAASLKTFRRSYGITNLRLLSELFKATSGIVISPRTIERWERQGKIGPNGLRAIYALSDCLNRDVVRIIKQLKSPTTPLPNPSPTDPISK